MTVVIATRDRCPTLLATLRRLCALPDAPAVIVVDNGSTDGSVAVVRHVAPQARVIELRSNLGVAARNAGTQAAATPLVAFCDDDSWWSAGALARAARHFAGHPRLGLLAGRILVGPEEHLDPTCERMARGPRLPGAPGPAIAGFLACAVVFRRDALLAVGGFEERFGLGGEEALLTMDLLTAGWTASYADDVVAHHHPHPGHRRGRRRAIVRNDLWTMWLRRPVGVATGATLRALTPGRLGGLADALAGSAWVWRERRVLPAPVERRLRMIARVSGRPTGVRNRTTRFRWASSSVRWRTERVAGDLHAALRESDGNACGAGLGPHGAHQDLDPISEGVFRLYAITSTTPGRRPSAQSPHDDAQLLARYARTRAPELRDRLVRRYLPLARYSASQYARGSEPFDDLLQVASVGLLKAIDRYEPARGAEFSSYALPTMAGELRRHFRDRSWNVRPPRDLQDHALAVERVTTALIADLGRSPTIEEIAERTGLGEDSVLEARQALASRHAVSFSLPASGDDGPDLGECMGTSDAGFDGAENRATLARLVRHLSHREREILRLRFDEDLTQAEIGERIGLSQMHVSRLLRNALEKLRREDRCS
ncbi:SigB/SigF/SigG family RNA polymerase sigma factor [Baekduia sp.]|uniref:SigB/SigF/SigG family RNA polymerase sigma factor n=1 Tax=Baekduia sp. TaxID=2600305 RepID=UPI002E0EE789